MRLIVQWETAGDRTRVASEQHADLVFGLLHELLAEDDLGLGLLQEQLSLVHVGNCIVTTPKLAGVQSASVAVAARRFLWPITVLPQLPLSETSGSHVQSK